MRSQQVDKAATGCAVSAAILYILAILAFWMFIIWAIFTIATNVS